MYTVRITNPITVAIATHNNAGDPTRTHILPSTVLYLIGSLFRLQAMKVHLARSQTTRRHRAIVPTTLANALPCSTNRAFTAVPYNRPIGPDGSYTEASVFPSLGCTSSSLTYLIGTAKFRF